MPSNEIELPDGKILFILPENESLDTVLAKKLDDVRPGEPDGLVNVSLSYVANTLFNHIKTWNAFQLIVDAESRKVVLEGERLIAQTTMGDKVMGRRILGRVEVPFHFLTKVELYSTGWLSGFSSDYGHCPMGVWLDESTGASKILNIAHEFSLTSLPQFRFFFPPPGKSMGEKVFYQGQFRGHGLMKAAIVAEDRICGREFHVTETEMFR